MSHLTTIQLSRSARRITRDPQAMHRTIAYALGERGLWSLPDPNTLLIRHESPVCWHTALEGIATSTHTITIDPASVGDRIDWAVIANPTKSVFVRGKRGTRKPLAPEEWGDWISRKLSPAIRLDVITHEPLPTLTGRKQDRIVRHARVCFTGTGIVRDAAALDEITRHGIGSGKAYGCGLLITRKQV